MNSPAPFYLQFTLAPASTQRLATLCGQFSEHLQQVESRLQVAVNHRGQQFEVSGKENAVKRAAGVLRELYKETANNKDITPEQVHLHLQQAATEMTEEASSSDNSVEHLAIIRTKRATIKPRGGNQQRYVRMIEEHDINFGIGPAGTGKTYLAVACAVAALEQDRVRRILLVRPAVEAGEKLGFLPGDLAQKVDPYLRPLYDALYEMLGFETVGKLIERNVIEVAPLAYMRGRTLNNSFIILDESQNTTRSQMKMFLTRIGFGSTAVITGDLTQVDLPRRSDSGLAHVCEVLRDVPGIGFTEFLSKDVVRHNLVQRIVEAYDAFDDAEKAATQQRDSELQ